MHVNGKLEEAGLEPLANLSALRKQFSILDDHKNIVRAKSRNEKLQAQDALEEGWQCKDEEAWSNLYCNYVVARRVVESCSSDDLSSVEIQEKERNNPWKKSLVEAALVKQKSKAKIAIPEQYLSANWRPSESARKLVGQKADILQITSCRQLHGLDWPSQPRLWIMRIYKHI